MEPTELIANASSGSWQGAAIYVAVAIAVLVVGAWAKRYFSGPGKATSSYDNLQEDLKDLRAEFANYKAQTEKQQTERDQQHREEIDQLRLEIGYWRWTAVNHLDNEVTELRTAWPTPGAPIPPLPPRKPMPPYPIPGATGGQPVVGA